MKAAAFEWALDARFTQPKLLAAAGSAMGLLVVVVFAIVLWPHKNAASALPAAKSQSAARSRAAGSRASSQRAHDYDNFATGDWVSLIANDAPFANLVRRQAFIGHEPKYDRGRIEDSSIGFQ